MMYGEIAGMEMLLHSESFANLPDDLAFHAPLINCHILCLLAQPLRPLHGNEPSAINARTWEFRWKIDEKRSKTIA
jgi:hypothetical protein